MITQEIPAELAKSEQSIVIDWRDDRAPSSTSIYYRIPRNLLVSQPTKASHSTASRFSITKPTDTDKISAALDQLGRVTIDDLEPETADNWYFKVIHSVNEADAYPSFLRTSMGKTHLVKKSVLKYLASKKYSDISQLEEDYVLDMLKTGDLDLQSYALDTIFEWGEFTNVNALAEVDIKNKYLGGELADFLNVQG